MKKTGKSLLAILMAAAMTVSMAPAPVFADSNESSADAAFESSGISGEAADAEDGSVQDASADTTDAADSDGEGSGEVDSTGSVAESAEDAATDSEEEDLVTESDDPVYSSDLVWEYAEGVDINPLYADIIDESDLTALPDQSQELTEEQDGPYASSEGEAALTSLEEAGTLIRSAMTKRESSIIISLAIPYSEDDTIYTVAEQMELIALKHTGNPKEGDYLLYQNRGFAWNCKFSNDDTTFYMVYTFGLNYYSTAEQEATVDLEVADLLTKLQLDNKSDYQKVKTIYDYICTNVTYDDEHAKDDTYYLQYTAYAALHNHTSVCQGYAVLLYRLLLEEGVEVRIVDGIGNGGKHSWNIIKLGSWYYDADSTWDSQNYHDQKEYECFLRSEENFDDHTRGADYTTEEFVSSHPMDVNDYDPDYNTDDETETASSGTCGANVTWTLDTNGRLVISGTGDMTDYSGTDPEKQSPWYQNSAVKSVVIKDGVTSVGSYAFYQCPNLTTVNLGYSVKQIWEYSFYSCEALKTVKLPGTLTTIGDCAFSGCTALNFVTNLASTSLSQMGKEVFYGCSSWETTLELPSTITFVAKEAFCGTACKEILIPNVDVTLGNSIMPSGSTIFGYYNSAAQNYCSGSDEYTFVCMKPAAPAELTAEVVDSTTIRLSWDAVEGAQTYRIYRAEGDETKFQSDNRTTSTIYTDTDLTTGTTYKYMIIAENLFKGTWYEGEQSNIAVCVATTLRITEQPTDTCTALKKNAVFTVTAENAASYQWQYSKNSGATWKSCSDSSAASSYESGTKTAELTMLTTNARYGYQYRCKVTGQDGTIFYTDAVKILKFAITGQPDNVYSSVGKMVYFGVEAENAVSYQWYYQKSGSSVWGRLSDNTTASKKMSGTGSDILSMKVNAARMTYSYRCRVTGADGTVKYTDTVKILPGNAVISEQPVSVEASVGESVTLSVGVQDESAVASYRWQYSKDGGKTWGSLTDNTKASTLMSGALTDTLTMRATTARMAMCFRCRVTGMDGVSVYTSSVTIG